MTSPRPLVVVIAGPNGAGKSTTAPRLLRGALEVDEFVNADTIARGLSAFHPQEVGLTAGRALLERLHVLAAARKDFAFETTLASRSFAPWLRNLSASGYRVHLTFLALPSADLASARVAERVRQGGHDVPEETIRRRFSSGLRNFFGVYALLVDSWQVFDNSHLSGPQLLAFRDSGREAEIIDRQAWKVLLEAQG